VLKPAHAIASRFFTLFVPLLVKLFAFVKDRPTPEMKGDRPAMFERILMKVFRYRDISKVITISPEMTHFPTGGTIPECRKEALYLRRFFLTPRTWPVRLFLHHIVRSDDDRDVHDHPWPFTTCILKGSYVEELCLDPEPDDFRLATPGTVHENPAEHTHRVEVIEPVWSLVIVGRAERVWGFWTHDGWKSWRDYLGVPWTDRDAAEDVIRSERNAP
jgi:hypothetical protein